VNHGYDSLYRLTSENVTSDPHNHDGTTSYTYDSVGNRQQLLVNGVTANSYTHDADDRLGSDTYDRDGNTISSFGTANAYDFENHLTQHGFVMIVYDGDGNRVSETVGGVTTSYLVDTQNPTGYAQVVDELQSGAVTRTYSYGLERISEAQSISGTATTSFYGYDGHGSVRQLTNSAGAVTDTFDYDAFGNLVSSTGSTPNNYLFAGEEYDAALGLYYNRARYLNTTTGRFWSMDMYEGSDQDPLSLHKYLYVGANPVAGTDPSGNQDLVTEVGAEAVDGTLEGQSEIEVQGVKNTFNAKVADVYFVARFSATSLVHAYLFVNVTAVNAGYTYDVQPDLDEETSYWTTLIDTVPGTLYIERATLSSVTGDPRNYIAQKFTSFSQLQWVSWTATVEAVAPFTTGEVPIPYSIVNGGAANCLKWSVVAALAALAAAKVEL